MSPSKEIDWQQAGIKNAPLLALLNHMVDIGEPLAAAIADNALDDGMPIPIDGANTLTTRLRWMASSIETAASAKTRSELDGLRLPSMSGKELV